MHKWREIVMISVGNCSCHLRSTLFWGKSLGRIFRQMFLCFFPSRPDKLDEVFSCSGKLAYFRGISASIFRTWSCCCLWIPCGSWQREYWSSVPESLRYFRLVISYSLSQRPWAKLWSNPIMCSLALTFTHMSIFQHTGGYTLAPGSF